MSTFTNYSKSGGTAVYPELTPPFSNYSLSFPGGAGNFATTTSEPMDDVGLNDVSFSFWFKWHSSHPGTNNYVFNSGNFLSAIKHGAIMFFPSSSKKFKARLQNGFSGAEVLSSMDIDDSAWRNIIITIDRNSTSYLYINGAEDDSVNYNTEFDFDSATSASLGAGLFGNSPLTNANIDDFAIWGTELTAADALKIYNSGKPTDLTQAASYDSDKSSNLIAYWKMEENTGSTIADSSGNGHTLTKDSSVTFSSDVPS